MADWDLRVIWRQTPRRIWGMLAPEVRLEGTGIGGKVARVQQQPSSFAAYIRQRRQQLGLSQEQVARRAGDEFQGAYIAKLERDGVETPSRDRLRKLAHALEVPIAALRALIYPDEGESPPVLPAVAPPVIDPALPDFIKDALRPLVGQVPDDDVRAVGRVLASMRLRSREEIEAREGPRELPPHDATHNGTEG